MEVVASLGPEEQNCVLGGWRLGGLDGSKSCGNHGQSSPALASSVRPTLNLPPSDGPLKVGKKWKKLARGSSHTFDQHMLGVGETQLTVGKRDRGLRDESSGSSAGSKKVKLSEGQDEHVSSLQSTVVAAEQPRRIQ
ncbi:hypothetical protein CsSME_00013153 [Camellia sinensis var. sinensis]